MIQNRNKCDCRIEKHVDHENNSKKNKYSYFNDVRDLGVMPENNYMI